MEIIAPLWRNMNYLIRRQSERYIIIEIMEHQKILNLLNEANNSKFATIFLNLSMISMMPMIVNSKSNYDVLTCLVLRSSNAWLRIWRQFFSIPLYWPLPGLCFPNSYLHYWDLFWRFFSRWFLVFLFLFSPGEVAIS